MSKTPAPHGHPDSEDLERFGDPLQSFGQVARLTFRAFARALEARILEHGVTIGQWRFLRELYREDGITQRELSERLSMREPSTVSAVSVWSTPSSSDAQSSPWPTIPWVAA